MLIEPEKGACSIVLLGAFNPTIFNPDWFAHHEIATSAERDDSTIHVIHPEIANFRLGTKLIQVDLTRFSIETSEAPWVSILDFVLKTFAQFLSHTPINRVGINRTVHFGVGTEEKRNKVGRMLAPTAPWGEWGRRIDASSKDKRGGFTNLTMLEPRGGAGGGIHATVQPSMFIKGNSGIFINVNDDHIFPQDEAKYAIPAMELLSGCFDASIIESEWIIDQIMSISQRI